MGKSNEAGEKNPDFLVERHIYDALGPNRSELKGIIGSIRQKLRKQNLARIVLHLERVEATLAPGTSIESWMSRLRHILEVRQIQNLKQLIAVRKLKDGRFVTETLYSEAG